MSRTGHSNLRTVLKRETAPLHDRLDRAWGNHAVGTRGEYAAFLQAQYRARKPIDQWIARATDGAGMDPADAPPRQAHLIAADIAALGFPLPATGRFELPECADPIGLQWALAGSSLGNRAMLAQRRKAGVDGPDSFLADEAMTMYFNALRSTLERPLDGARPEGAIAAAKAVFACFLAGLEPFATDQADEAA